MRRGRRITKGLTLALPFALRRGHVMVFVAALLNLAEFLITGNGLFVLVRVRLARRIRGAIADIEHEFADAIAGLRLIPRAGPVSCELWLYSKHGTFRHFQVEESRLAEIDCWGAPLELAGAKTGSEQTGGPADARAAPAATTVAGKRSGPVAAVLDPKSPISRWLKRWNAGQTSGNATEGKSSPNKILKAGEPGWEARPGAGKNESRKKGAAGTPEKLEDERGTGTSVVDDPGGSPKTGVCPEGSLSGGCSRRADDTAGYGGSI